MKMLILIIVTVLGLCCFVACRVISEIDVYSYSSGQIEVSIEKGKVIGISVKEDKRKREAINQNFFYLKFRNEERSFLLGDITPNDLGEEYLGPLDLINSSYSEGSVEYANGAFVRFIFTNSKLVYVSLSGHIPKTAPLISNKKEGPFYGFPLSKRQVKELFGEPESKKKITRP